MITNNNFKYYKNEYLRQVLCEKYFSNLFLKTIDFFIITQNKEFSQFLKCQVRFLLKECLYNAYFSNKGSIDIFRIYSKGCESKIPNSKVEHQSLTLSWPKTKKTNEEIIIITRDRYKLQSRTIKEPPNNIRHLLPVTTDEHICLEGNLKKGL